MKPFSFRSFATKLAKSLRGVLAIGLISALGTVALAQQYDQVERKVEIRPDQSLTEGFEESLGDAVGDTSSNPAQRALGSRTRPGLECAPGRNGGSTDTGVTATNIRLAATVVQTGIGASFLDQSPIGMKAVAQRVNQAGGICGRTLDLTLVDDGWDARQGQEFLRNFIAEGYFALPVVPSSEGLTAAIEGKFISQAGIPVVGSDGMLIQQYQDPWVWPVAAATVSTMRIMAKHAHDTGSRSFGIVYDEKFRFGREGAEAFRQQVNKMTGADPKAFVGVQPGRASYSSEIQQFNVACGDAGCDFVALLLEPATAETLIAGRPRLGTKLTGGAQTLFNERFAKNCGAPCGGMFVWTGYNPPIGPLAQLPGVKQFVNDVRLIRPTADETNQFMEGAYFGMSIFVEALRQVGPDLTRARLRAALNSMTHQSDLASSLTWTAQRRHANIRAQAFSIVVAGGSFAGFRNEQTGFIADPALE